jgi:type I restriction enzyme S subunit
MLNNITVPLGEIAEDIVVGYVGPMSQEYVEQGVPFLRSLNVSPFKFDSADIKFVSSEFHQKIRKSALKPGDVVVVRTGNPGVSCVVPESLPDANCSDLIVIRPGSNLDPHFLCYYINSITQSHIKGQLVGAIQQHFNIGAAKEILFPKVSRDYQQRIAAVLTTLDAKIELNNRINEELEGMAKLLYDYWFVQFDFPMTAARAAALGKPHLTGHPYRASGGKMIYNETLKREIPLGWEHSTIGETFKTHLGGTPSRQNGHYWNPGELNWLSSGENPSTFVLAPDEKISKLGLLNSPAKLLPAGTVVLSIVRHLRASILGIEAATNQSVVGMLETPSFKHCFIYPYIVREIPRLMVLRTGAQQPHINKGVLDESPLVIPDEPTLGAYTKLASPLFSQIKNHQQQNQELTQLRDWLLPMLMNGQVTVGTTEH